MGVKWTEEQQQVIDLRDHNILLFWWSGLLRG